MTGTLYGVGVGPGDPELLTVKAYRILKEADVIAYPKKRSKNKSYAHQIIEPYVNEQEREMYGFVFPMTKDKTILEKAWSYTVDQLWKRLSQGKDVAFVTEGDPLLYSTFIHTQRMLNERYPEANVEVVPGISSINGAASRLNLPLADGDDTILIIPARNDYEAMKQAIIENDCVVFLKVAKVKTLMLDILQELDLLDHAACVTKVTSEEEIVWKMDELKDVDLGYLTLMVVRK